jgi:hypothetical protein
LTSVDEDAHLLSLATFGTDGLGNMLGVDLFVTFDRKCQDRFLMHLAGIEQRFAAMAPHLPRPYREAALPEVVSPTAILELLTMSEL